MKSYRIEISAHGEQHDFSVQLTDEELDALQMKAHEINRISGSNMRIQREHKV
ncbi:hypothetical protein ACQZV8_11555 [Magnetococcales bacterium HHB-1]